MERKRPQVLKRRGSDPMRWPVPCPDRYEMHLPALGEANPTYEKKVPCASSSRALWTRVFSDQKTRRTAPSKRFDHRQDHDCDHQHGGHLIDNAIKTGGTPVPVPLEIPRPSQQETVHSGEHQNEKDLCL